MEVYVATSGSYSDYKIEGIFANEEDAREYARKIYEGDYTSYEVLEGPAERRYRYYLSWHGHSVNSKPYVHSYPEPYDQKNARPVVRLTYNEGLPGVTFPTLLVEAWSKEEVMKVYSDERAKHFAREEGIS